MTAQLRLSLPREPDYSRARFAVSGANAVAMQLIERHRSGALALVGPEGSGKTHLAHIWAQDRGARNLNRPPPDASVLAGQRLVIEDADTFSEEALFHLFNMVQVSGAILLTSRRLPRQWPAALPDLRSRLAALPIAELPEPDDIVLASILGALFEERHIRPAPEVIPYLLMRMERSAASARALVEQLDEAAASQRREINRALVAEVLGPRDTADLFDPRR